jgi:hypothetical protein
MCSITSNQHQSIGGTLAPGETKTFPNDNSPIWNNTQSHPGRSTTQPANSSATILTVRPLVRQSPVTWSSYAGSRNILSWSAYLTATAERKRSAVAVSPVAHLQKRPFAAFIPMLLSAA